MQDLLTTLTPLLANALLALLTILVPIGLARLNGWLKTKTDATTAAALDAAAEAAVKRLHGAVETGVKAALAAGTTDPKAIALSAATYAKASIPGTLSDLKPAEDVLQGIALAKLKGITG